VHKIIYIITGCDTVGHPVKKSLTYCGGEYEESNNWKPSDYGARAGLH
jgi:hypothetical protein